MKILLLGDASNPHIIKWANALTEQGSIVFVFSLVAPKGEELRENIQVFVWKVPPRLKALDNGSWTKLFYMLAVFKLKKIIHDIQPDILHAHYASSYGLLGTLSCFHPRVISVWGMDVYEFPKRSILHKKVFTFNINKSDSILSTSLTMARETKKYTSREVIVTPFGIDINRFKPGEKFEFPIIKNALVIGTIKALEIKYGIEYLIEAFSIVKAIEHSIDLKLLIVGTGGLEGKIKELIREKRLETEVILTGAVNYSVVHQYHNLLDIYVALSVSDDESFGVAVLEASACEKPVVVSNVGGLPEIVQDGITGFIVPSKNTVQAAQRILDLIHDKKLREEMGKRGRERVELSFNLQKNIHQMMDIYRNLINEFKSQGKKL